ncbi:UDP-N-acetylmuramoyl-L-alanyl-D-glutamate--2,6-diaminopimelate ligase [Bacteroidota bacterium]
MRLTDLLKKISTHKVIGEVEPKWVEKITNDSREVDNNTLFIAIRGYEKDGHDYVLEAISKNASAIILQEDVIPDDIFLKSGCVKILVKNSRETLAQVSDTFYNKPSVQINLIGITGTKGKTTTTYLIKNVLMSAGYKVGLIGTIANYIDQTRIDTRLTTPEAHTTNKLLRNMVENKCEYCVMEVSSHALSLGRVNLLDFKYGIFTNITADHFDFHHDFQSYLKAKKTLFDNLNQNSTAIINSDDKSYNQILKDSAAKTVLYGIDGEADFRISKVDFSLDGTTFNLTHNNFNEQFTTQLIGEFTAYNAAAAIALTYSIGIDLEIIKKGILSTPQVPGRFEVIGNKNKKVVVDYSHTADSLRKALNSIKHINQNKQPIFTVFGCGGSRDKGKRPVMGEIASSLSNKVFITSDNPRNEDPYKIIDDILQGIKEKNYEVIENREEAIKKALTDDDNAIVLIAGKGHENYQEINGVRNHFSDKEVALKYMGKCQE